MIETDDESAAMAYASAFTDWGDAGGYRAEVLWTPAAPPRSACVTLSGSEQKRLVLEALLRGPDEVLLRGDGRGSDPRPVVRSFV
jgi:hypothetical protein